MKVEILAKTIRDDEGNVYKVPAGLRIVTPPPAGKHNFHTAWLEQHKRYLTQTKDKIILHTVDGNVHFWIDYPPGRFCLTCGEELPKPSNSAEDAQICRDHVVTHGESAIKTEKWPHGYRSAQKSYACTMVEG